MDVWFWIHMYVVWRGVSLIVWETLDRIVGTDPDKLVTLRMRMPSLKSLFKYVSLLRRHDLRNRRPTKFPRLIVEGTYYPPEAMLAPYVTVQGDASDEDKARMLEIVNKYPMFARPDAVSTKTTAKASKQWTWMKIVALRANLAHHAVFTGLHRLCRDQGGFLVATVTNDPFASSSLILIGIDPDMQHDIQKIAKPIVGLKITSF